MGVAGAHPERRCSAARQAAAEEAGEEAVAGHLAGLAVGNPPWQRVPRAARGRLVCWACLEAAGAGAGEAEPEALWSALKAACRVAAAEEGVAEVEGPCMYPEWAQAEVASQEPLALRVQMAGQATRAEAAAGAEEAARAHLT